MHVCVCVCACTYVCVHVRLCHSVCVHVCMLMCMYMCVCVHVCRRDGGRERDDILWKGMNVCCVCRVGLSDDFAAPKVNHFILMDP